MNFALGVRDFDPSKHQPHPPGYPVFIALGKLSHALWPSDAGSLSVWSAVFGALSVFPLIVLFRSIESLDGTSDGAARDSRAALATIVVVGSPLFWLPRCDRSATWWGSAWRWPRRRASHGPSSAAEPPTGQIVRPSRSLAD
jgi:hypothetical protein